MSITSDFKFIQKVFNDAFHKELIDYHVNPFHKYKLKSEKTQRCFLIEDELRDFVKIPTKGLELHRKYKPKKVDIEVLND